MVEWLKGLLAAWRFSYYQAKMIKARKAGILMLVDNKGEQWEPEKILEENGTFKPGFFPVGYHPPMLVVLNQRQLAVIGDVIPWPESLTE